MKCTFNSITEKIENTKIKSVINDGLSFSEELFKEIRKALPKLLKIEGFTSIQKVPFHSFGKLTHPINNSKFYCNNNISRLILKGWYLKNSNLVDIVKNKLSEGGYEINIPDFDLEKIELKTLNQKDIFETGDELTYYHPNGEIINGIDDIDATLIAALLGWISFPTELLDNFSDDIICNKLNEQSESLNTKLDDLELPKENKRDSNKVEIEYSIAENNPTIETLFELLVSKSKEGSEFFLKIAEDLNNGLFPDKDQIISRISDIKETFDLLKKKIGSEEVTQINSINVLKDFYFKSIEIDNKLKSDKEFINDILDKILKLIFKKGETISFIEVLFEITNNFKIQLKSSEVQNEEWFINMISQQHFLNYIIQAIDLVNFKDPDYIELDMLLSKIKLEFTNNNIDFYEQLAAQINRNNLMFSNSLLLDSLQEISENDSIEPPVFDETKEKSDDTYIPEMKLEKEIESVDKNIKTQENIFPRKTNKETCKKEIEIEVTKNSNTVIHENGSIPDIQENKYLIIDKTESAKLVETKPFENIITEIGISSLEIEENEEDKNILKLLNRHEIELAFHLAKCYENENKKLFIPSNLLANLILSLRVRNAEGPIASMIASNIENYDLSFEKTERSHFKNKLIFASILRSSIFAFMSSGSGLVLDEISTGKISEISGIKKVILDFMSHFDGVLNFDILSQIFGETQLRVQQEDLFINIGNWIEKAQISKYRGLSIHNYSNAFSNWVKIDGWLCKILSQFNLKKDINIIKQLLVEELNESVWQKKFDRELIAVDPTGRHMNNNSDATRWIKSQIDSLKDLLTEGMTCFTQLEYKSTTKHQKEVLGFVKDLKKEILKANALLESEKLDNTYSIVSNYILKKALNNLLDVLEGHEIGNQINMLDNIVYGPLLKLQFYESGLGLEPKQYDKVLVGSLLMYIKSNLQSTIEICENHLKTGNIEAYNRLMSLLNPERIDIKQVTKYDDFSGRFEFELQKAKTSIERGCAYGYISDELRTIFISSLEEVNFNHNNRNNNEGINYPLSKTQIMDILSEVESLKNNTIQTHEKFISNDFKLSEREVLKSYLTKGNILVFNETLERINNGQYETFEESSGLLQNFFQNYLSYPNGGNSEFILKAIHAKQSLYGIDFNLISESQIKQAEDLMENWYFLKNRSSKNSTDNFNNLKILLEGLGFVSPDFSESETTKRKNSVFYDFKCSIIKGKSRSPIPQFGSIAKGSYRLICIKESLNEEDLIEEIKALSPETDRGVIIFTYFWMSKQYRLEIARLSKKSRITSLMLDEAMLVYLCGIKGSKLPAFIKLATPFTFVEPYQTSSSNLPEEMFYGRSAQIQKLKNITGDFSCLIYGGRQLGKTVLQREVERVFHNPNINNYAKYIDLRESGIGLWNPIEEITTVLIENLKFIPGLIPDKISPSIKLDALLLKFKEWFDKNNEARIILFLDESDKFLDQDTEKDWQHILLLKGLMEKTNKRFKIILAGMHNVRRTNAISNSPLAHFGNPICIGPMLNKDEAIEAQMLIKFPLETLGYEFETEDLALMILSHCNWYPSLIQIFCSKLLNVLHEKRNITQLPIIITDKDVTKAYDRSKDLIKEKFCLTLSLDERYDLLANIIAGETIDNPSVQSSGISLEDITELAIITWPDGFESTNPQFVVCNLLDEMIDLGVLRLVSKANYALRTPNLRDLIGSSKQIKDNLGKIRIKPQEFKRQTSRIIYNPSGKREQRSPITASYYDKIMDTEINVLILRGSKVGGIDYIEEFLNNRKKAIHLIYPEVSTKNIIDFEVFLENLDKKRIQGIRNIIFINHNVSYSVEDVMYLNEKISKKIDLSALFLMSPEQTWEIMSKNDKSFEKLENHNIPVICISQWKEDIAKDWFKETGCVNARIPAIFEITGNWHYLLDKYHERIFNNPEKWKDFLSEFDTEILSKKEGLLFDLGLSQVAAIKMIKILIEWDGGLSKQEFINEYQSVDAPWNVKNYLYYFLCLNIINNELKVNNLVKRLINHG